IDNQGVAGFIQRGNAWLGYDLDDAGNRLRQHSPTGEIESTPSAANQYQSFGAPLLYDSAGNLKAEGRDAYGFDGRGHLITATVDAATRGTRHARYGYDAIDRRIFEQVDDQPPQYLVWDGLQVAALGSSPTDTTSYTVRVGAGFDAHVALVENKEQGRRW